MVERFSSLAYASIHGPKVLLQNVLDGYLLDCRGFAGLVELNLLPNNVVALLRFLWNLSSPLRLLERDWFLRRTVTKLFLGR